MVDTAGAVSHFPLEVGRVSRSVGPENVPETIRSLGRISKPDYVDLYSVRTAGATQGTAEQWARAILEEAPVSRRNARMLWRFMGMRLGPRGSPEHIQGWNIAARGDNWLVAETGSWYLTAQAVFLVEQDQISISLSLRYDHPVAAAVWRLIEGPHQRAVPVMLHQAVRAMDTPVEPSTLPRTERARQNAQGVSSAGS
jgi:hypothetical protein